MGIMQYKSITAAVNSDGVVNTIFSAGYMFHFITCSTSFWYILHFISLHIPFQASLQYRPPLQQRVSLQYLANQMVCHVCYRMYFRRRWLFRLSGLSLPDLTSVGNQLSQVGFIIATCFAGVRSNLYQRTRWSRTKWAVPTVNQFLEPIRASWQLTGRMASLSCKATTKTISKRRHRAIISA